MRSIKDELTAKTVIRNEALRLFAQRGPDAISVRDIASAAGVSPALVLHHWGSKEGLRAGVVEYVGVVVDGLLEEITAELLHSEAGPAAPPPADPGRATGDDPAVSLTQAMLTHLPPTSPVPAYLRRLWLTADPSGIALLRRWYDASLDLLTRMAAAGAARPGVRPDVRAGVLMANDLAVLLLREGLEQVLGEDPLAPAGLAHWTDEVLDLYQHGLLLDPRRDDASSPER